MASRAAAWASDSPGSRWPAGWFRRTPSGVSSSTIRKRPSRSTTAATVTLGFQGRFMTEGKGMPAAGSSGGRGFRVKSRFYPAAAPSHGVERPAQATKSERERFMKIGVPAEIRPGETRVAASPETVKKLVAGKHTVLVQSGAGVPAAYPDDAYAAAGATI